MKINEVEQATGIAKKNIRFYEQEGLLNPCRTANGYRDYSQKDIDTLQQIKLFRKLAIPLEEIRRLQSGSQTLDDCLRRHLIVLERKSKNLEAIEQFCGKILTENPGLQTLPAERLLAEMEDMEKGGSIFVDIRKKDKKKKKQDAIVAAAIAITFMALFLGTTIWALAAAPGAPILFVILTTALPIIGITGTLMALAERLKEIEGGELDEASKY